MGNCQTYSEDEDAKQSSGPRGRSQIIVKTETWLRDSYGLFDYENSNISHQQFKSYNPGRIMRTGTEVSMLKENETHSSSEDTHELLNIQLKDGNFWVGSSQPPKSNGEGCIEYSAEDLERAEAGIWLVIKSLKGKNNNKGYHLSEGDLIKLGRVKIKVVELKKTMPTSSESREIEIAKRTGTEPDSSLEGDDDPANRFRDSIKSSGQAGAQVCRICLSESSSTTNPLFSPCKCAGTMKNVHIKCLQTWLRSKLYIKEMPQVLSFYLKSFECELCKTLYPNFFEINGVKYDIVQVERPKVPYMILEVLSKEGTALRGLHVIKMDKKNNIRLGRGHESDIRITDISVSRFHAIINLDKDGFYLDDNGSKFGTLIYMNQPFPIYGNFENVSVQVGRTVASFSVKRSWRVFSLCLKNPAISPCTLETETKIESREQLSRAEKDEHINTVELDGRPMVAPVPRNGFAVRSNRTTQGPQRPLGGDDDIVEMEEGAQRGNDDFFNDIEDDGGQMQEDPEIVVVRD